MTRILPTKPDRSTSQRSPCRPPIPTCESDRADGNGNLHRVAGPGGSYSAIASRFGEIRSCFALDADRGTWILTTLGNRASHGVVGIYRCATLACRDGRNDHVYIGWKFYAAPYD